MKILSKTITGVLLALSLCATLSSCTPQKTQNTEPTIFTNKEAAKTSGQYISLGEFQKNPQKYETQSKIYFFHASWCPICASIEKEILADPTKIPAHTILIKTDFDQETALRQKYGVTTQYTFVEFDNEGNQISQWSATSLADAITGMSKK